MEILETDCCKNAGWFECCHWRFGGEDKKTWEGHNGSPWVGDLAFIHFGSSWSEYWRSVDIWSEEQRGVSALQTLLKSFLSHRVIINPFLLVFSFKRGLPLNKLGRACAWMIVIGLNAFYIYYALLRGVLRDQHYQTIFVSYLSFNIQYLIPLAFHPWRPIHIRLLHVSLSFFSKSFSMKRLKLCGYVRSSNYNFFSL